MALRASVRRDFCVSLVYAVAAMPTVLIAALGASGSTARKAPRV